MCDDDSWATTPPGTPIRLFEQEGNDAEDNDSPMLRMLETTRDLAVGAVILFVPWLLYLVPNCGRDWWKITEANTPGCIVSSIGAFLIITQIVSLLTLMILCVSKT